MKILILANKGSYHAKKVAEGLAERGHRIIFVTPNDKLDKGVEISDKIESVTLRSGGKVGYFLNAYEFRRLCKKYKPDVVNVHYASGCGLLSYLAGIHPVLSCYGSDIYEFPRKNKFNAFLLRRILRSAKQIASTSRIMAEEIRRVIREDTRNITITPFGIDINRFKSIDNIPENQRPIVGIVKGLYPIYDISLLIKGFSIAYKKLGGTPILKIYGDGPLRGELEIMVKTLDLQDSILFMGYVNNNEVPNILNGLDIFVNTSKQESFGVNLLEAMACEIPVIATDCPGPKEIIEDGVSGIILRDRNPETLAKVIIDLINNKVKRITIGKAGRARVLECYDWNKNLDVLESLMNKFKER